MFLFLSILEDGFLFLAKIQRSSIYFEKSGRYHSRRDGRSSRALKKSGIATKTVGRGARPNRLKGKLVAAEYTGAGDTLSATRVISKLIHTLGYLAQSFWRLEGAPRNGPFVPSELPSVRGAVTRSLFAWLRSNLFLFAFVYL